LLPSAGWFFSCQGWFTQDAGVAGLPSPNFEEQKQQDATGRTSYFKDIQNQELITVEQT